MEYLRKLRSYLKSDETTGLFTIDQQKEVEERIMALVESIKRQALAQNIPLLTVQTAMKKNLETMDVSFKKKVLTCLMSVSSVSNESEQSSTAKSTPCMAKSAQSLLQKRQRDEDEDILFGQTSQFNATPKAEEESPETKIEIKRQKTDNHNVFKSNEDLFGAITIEEPLKTVVVVDKDK